MVKRLTIFTVGVKTTIHKVSTIVVEIKIWSAPILYKKSQCRSNFRDPSELIFVRLSNEKNRPLVLSSSLLVPCPKFAAEDIARV